MNGESTPARPGQHPSVVQLVNVALASAIEEQIDQIDVLWRGDDFAITLRRGGVATSEVPVPPRELWEGVLDRIDELTTWKDNRTGLIRLDFEGKQVDCHVLARHRSLSHHEVQMILEPSS